MTERIERICDGCGRSIFGYPYYETIYHNVNSESVNHYHFECLQPKFIELSRERKKEQNDG